MANRIIQTSGGSRQASDGIGAVAALVATTFLVLAAMSPGWLLYDERYYMQASYFLSENNSFLELMATPLDVAAGPLYAYLHFGLSPLTDLQPPTIRFVNLVCLGGTVAAIAAALARLGQDSPFSRAAMLLAVPTIGPTAGLALTELPALFAATLALLAAIIALGCARPGRRLCWFVVAGAFAGLAVLGRQTYLPALAAFAAIALTVSRARWSAVAGFGVALVVVAPMLVAWRGLTPPWQVGTVGGLVPQHAVLAFVYLAAAAFLIAPRFFTSALAGTKDRIIGLGLAAVAACVAVLAGLQFGVASRVIDVLPDWSQPIVRLGLNLSMVGLGALFVVVTMIHCWTRRKDRGWMMFAAIALLLNGTAIGIAHQFSSRYVLIAFPFALAMLQPWFVPNRWAAVRLACGASLGFASLAAYYWNAPPNDPNTKLLAPAELIAKMPLQSEQDVYRNDR